MEYKKRTLAKEGRDITVFCSFYAFVTVRSLDYKGAAMCLSASVNASGETRLIAGSEHDEKLKVRVKRGLPTKLTSKEDPTPPFIYPYLIVVGGSTPSLAQQRHSCVVWCASVFDVEFKWYASHASASLFVSFLPTSRSAAYRQRAMGKRENK